MSNSNPSLEKRIAAALGEADGDTNDLAALVAEVEAALGSVEAEATHCMARALDPMIVDPDAKGRADQASFMATRLKNGLPRLRELHGAAAARDALAAHDAALAVMQAKRDTMASKLRSVYAECAERIIALFDELAAVDAEVAAFNRSAPAGGRGLIRAEFKSRGIESFGMGKSIVEQVKLPVFQIGNGVGPAPLAWPRPEVPLAIQMMGLMPKPAPPTPEEMAEAEALGGWPQFFEQRKIREAERVAEQGRARERGRERLNAEAAEAAITAEAARRYPGI